MKEANIMDLQQVKVDGRSKAAREAKRESAAAAMRHAKMVTSTPVVLAKLVEPNVIEAVRVVEHVQNVRNSVRRKLLGGSQAVDSALLAELEGQLASSRTALATLAPNHPLIIASTLIESQS
jgi:hypothetical protein